MRHLTVGSGDYWVGRVDGFQLGKDSSSPDRIRFKTLADAEQWIAEQASVDPDGVKAGLYFIDGLGDDDD